MYTNTYIYVDPPMVYCAQLCQSQGSYAIWLVVTTVYRQRAVPLTFTVTTIQILRYHNLRLLRTLTVECLVSDQSYGLTTRLMHIISLQQAMVS